MYLSKCYLWIWWIYLYFIWFAKIKIQKSFPIFLFQFYSTKSFKDESISIDKEKCVNADSLDLTKVADIYCAYADAAILYSDGTKNEFKTSYFLPYESIKSKKLDPTT